MKRKEMLLEKMKLVRNFFALKFLKRKQFRNILRAREMYFLDKREEGENIVAKVGGI